jgi:hypothetical protein
MEGKKAGPLHHLPGVSEVPVRTPGSLGLNDVGNPNRMSLLGNTPGSLGYNDVAAQIAGISSVFLPSLLALGVAPGNSERFYHRTSNANVAEELVSAATNKTAVVKLSPADFSKAASSLGPGVSVAIIRAFAEVESGGRSGFAADGRPIIAYEGHWFRKLTKKEYDEAYPMLSYPYLVKAGPEWQANNKDQATAWKTLEAAMALSSDAALQSCSWGMFQVMGFNWEDCGYEDVTAFVAAMKAGEPGQLAAFVGYCLKKHGMVTALKTKNFIKMAELYNGKDYGDYDKRIQKAYKKYDK